MIVMQIQEERYLQDTRRLDPRSILQRSSHRIDKTKTAKWKNIAATLVINTSIDVPAAQRGAE